MGDLTEFSQPAFSQVLANSRLSNPSTRVCSVADAQLQEEVHFRSCIHGLIGILLVGLSRGGSSNTLEQIGGRLVAMASQSRTLPVLVAAACCVAVLRSFLATSQQTFVAPQQSVHMGCQALSGGALASGNVPAIVNTVPARPGVPAHFKVTLETPDGTQSFASWQHFSATHFTAELPDSGTSLR